MRRLWSVPGFGRLAVAYSLNELALFIASIALAVLVYRQTGSALGSAGFFLCSQGVPAVLAPGAVGLLDRASPRILLPLLYWTEGVLYGVLAWLAGHFLLAPMLAIVIVDGVIALVARSLSAGARTELLKPVDLVREGGALQSMMFSAAYLTGPLLAGVIAAAGGTRTALIVSAGLFAVLGLSLQSRTIPTAIVHEGPARGRLRAAVAYARSDRPVATLLTLQTFAYIAFTLPVPIEVVYAVHTQHAGAAGYGVLLAVWGGGAVLGSLGYARWRLRSVHLLLGVATAMLAVGFAVMAVAPVFGVGLIGAALAGLGNGLSTGAFYTEFTAIVPQSWVALVTSFNQSLGQLAPGIGIALGGLITALASVRVTLAVAAAASIVMAVAIVVLLSPRRTARPEIPAPIEVAPSPFRVRAGIGAESEARAGTPT